mgnify:CR=1 FL=1
MSLLLTAPERLCIMLKDCDDAVIAAYHLHQDDIDYVERPCFLVTSGEATYEQAPESASEQVAVTETYTIDYIGEPFKGTEQDYADFHELEARRIAYNAIVYLLKHPNLQFSNVRHLEETDLPPLDGVFWARPESRSVITLMQRAGREEAFWGFTISYSMRSMVTANEDEYMFSAYEA